MLRDPVSRIGGVGVGLAPILTRRKKKEIDIPQTTQSSDVAISMMLASAVLELSVGPYYPAGTSCACLYKSAHFF
jgi:hypothetical protein